MAETREEAWRSFDAIGSREHIGGGYDEPLRALIVATHGTPLRQFFPCTSMNRLFFTPCPFPWERADIKPGCIEFWPEGVFAVFAGTPYDDDAAQLATTRDPDQAVHELLTVLDLKATG